MAGTFPVIRSGVSALYPAQEGHQYRTVVDHFDDDSEARYVAAAARRPFEFRLRRLNGRDAARVRTFFSQQHGSFDTFDLEHDGVTYEGMAFAGDELAVVEEATGRYTMTVRLEQRSVHPEPSSGTIPRYFPPLNAAGTLAQVPFGFSVRHRTLSEDLMDGGSITFRGRDVPLLTWRPGLAGVTDAELEVVRNLFHLCRGRRGEFAYLDPDGNLVPNSDDFSAGSWSRTGALTVGALVPGPIDDGDAVTLTNADANGMTWCTVLPDGDGAGHAFCASVWARSNTPGPLHIGFIDSAFGVVAGRATPVGAEWTRISCPTVAATNSYLRLLIGGLGTWGARSIELFGAQVSPTIGPGARRPTPGCAALRPRCRFESDQFVVTRIAPDLNSVDFAIKEYR